MKKLLSLILSLLTLTAAFAQEHSHTPSGLIDMDNDHRWEVCSCGEKLNVTAHEWDVDEWGGRLCMHCGATGYAYEDGSTDLTGYDADFNYICQLYWDENGELLQHENVVYTYGEDGAVLAAMHYEFGVLTNEVYYTADEDGMRQESRVVYHHEEGMIETQYNDRGEPLTITDYAPDGSVIRVTRCEYTYDENGNSRNTREYINDVLVQEIDYAVLEDEDSICIYTARVVYWEEDGSSTVYTCNEDGDIILEQYYDAGGNLVNEIVPEINPDDEWNDEWEEGVTIVLPSITLLTGDGSWRLTTIAPGQAFGEAMDLSGYQDMEADPAFTGWRVYDVLVMESSETPPDEEGLLFYQLYDNYFMVLREYEICRELVSTEELAQIVCDVTDHVVIANYQ